MKDQKKTKVIFYILSYFIPVFIWIGVCVLRGIYPFGSHSIMTGDIICQFIDYIAYYKTIILSNNNFWYSFSKTIGGNLTGFSAYYLYSPFNIIILFFSNRLLPLGVLLIIILKSGCLSLSFYYMLNRLFGFRKEAIVFSVTYSFTGFAVVYFQLYAYFDDLILLPLIVTGIYLILENTKNKWLYIASLFFAICINYYIGWMICIFCAVFFIYELYLQKKGLSEIISFGISSAIAGSMAAFIVIPSVLSMQGEKNIIDVGFYLTMNVGEVFERFLVNSFKGNISNCLPNLYIGVTLFIFAILYFTNKNIEKRERIASFVILLFLCVNLTINTLNVIWHGLNNPIGFPFRYSFLISFLLILFAYKNWINFDKEELFKKIVIIGSVITIYIVVLSIKGNEVLSIKDSVLNIVIIGAVSIALYLYYINKIDIRTIILVISAIQIFELSENIYDSFKYFEFADINEYQNFIDDTSEEINTIKNFDEGFYRIEKTYRRSHNDAMQLNYNGLSHFSSCEKKDYLKYMEELGFRNNGNWAFYDSGSTSFVDSLLGVKYIVSQYDTIGKPYERISSSKDNEYFIFKNPYALPMMFYSDEKIGEKLDTKNTFEFQNDIADAVNGKENNIFTPVDIKNINIENLTVEEKDGIRRYSKIDKNKRAYIEYVINPLEKRKNRRIKLYFKAPDLQEAIISKDDKETWEYFDTYYWNILDVGKAGKKEVSIKIELQSDVLELEDSYLYYENTSILEKWFSSIYNEETYLNKISSSKLEGKITAENDGRVVFSFPYDKGWTVKIDGEKTEVLPAAEKLLSARISKGEHKIELNYVPAGTMPGIVISIMAFCSLLVLINIDKHKILWSKFILRK